MVVCSSDTGTSDTGSSSVEGRASFKSKGTIGYSALTLTNPFFKTIADSMEAKAHESGYELLIVSGDQDVKKQSDQVDEFIVKDVSAIVLNPCDKSSIGPAIKKANDAGVPVFTNDLPTLAVRGKPSAMLQLTLGVPNPVWMMIGLYAIAHVVMSRTVFGRYIYAIGGTKKRRDSPACSSLCLSRTA